MRVKKEPCAPTQDRQDTLDSIFAIASILSSIWFFIKKIRKED